MRLNKTLIPSLMLLTVLTTNTKADCPTALETSRTALNKCLQVLDQKQEVIDQYQVSQAERDKLLADTQAALKAEQESKHSWFRNPFLWAVLGIGIGVAITK